MNQEDVVTDLMDVIWSYGTKIVRDLEKDFVHQPTNSLLLFTNQ